MPVDRDAVEKALKELRNIKDLEDTIDLMKSTDFRDRLVAEYYQVKIRLEKLNEFLHSDRANVLSVQDYQLMSIQANTMKSYAAVLLARIHNAGIVIL